MAQNEKMPRCNLFVWNDDKTFKNDLAIYKFDDLWWKMFFVSCTKMKVIESKYLILYFKLLKPQKRQKNNQNVFNIIVEHHLKFILI